MKKYIRLIIGLLIFIPFNGCDVDDQLLQDAPESVVLFARQTLEQEIYKAPNMEDYSYSLYLYRSGVNRSQEIQVNLSVSEAALDEYNEESGSDYVLLPSDYYSYDNPVHIPGGEEKGICQVIIHADRIAEEIGFNDPFVIPFLVNESTLVNTNSDNDVVLLKVTVREPVILQQTYGLEQGSAMGTETYNKALQVYVEFENEWDIELGYEVDYSLVESYNDEHGTDFHELPETQIEHLPASFTLPAGSQSTVVDLAISADGLEYFEPYLLPIRLVSRGEFPVDPSREIIYLHFMRDFDPAMAEMVPLTVDMIETFTQETVEGPKESLVDGDTGTYWHSAWSGGVEPLPHHIQINFDELTELGGMNYTFRQPSGITDRPNKFDIQISDDGQEWTTVWTSQPGLPVEPVDEKQTLVFDQNYSSQYYRIRILETYGNRNWTHLSTIEVFRVID